MDENEHHKEVYAHFGLAMFKAQVLEYAIVNALALCDLVPNRRDKALSAKAGRSKLTSSWTAISLTCSAD